MRFSQYKLVNELFLSVIEAVEYMSSHKTDILCDACIQCNDAIIKKLESDNEYDDILSNLNRIIELFKKNIYKSDELDILLDNIKYQLKNKVKYRLRVLFVAEIGSKWDSMASVYEAFKKRNDVDVDVVLEPVFRSVKLEDGTERKDVIYDDYLTPLGIKYYRYNQYDISKIMPDITFISQPYESVTTPEFWPENIAKHSKLVYLPYYTALMLNQVENITYESFFKLKTQEYSWKIACQSENMKNAYKMYGSKYGKNVIVSGLPKWDYPLSLNKKNTPCPLKWQKKIKGRKVFLLNTHFSIDDIQELFCADGIDFIKNVIARKDIALIWRPHPMTLSIIKVYAPDFLEPYNELIKLINDSENMIYDDNKSYSYSFLWSDSLLSLRFYSSLISQYLLMDKPVTMIAFNLNKQKSYLYDYDKELFDFTKISVKYGLEQIFEYINQVASGIDSEKDDRQYLRNHYYALADGKSGQRLSEKLISAFESEFVFTESKEKSEKMVVLGNKFSSEKCINQFVKHNISFDVCTEFWGEEDCDYSKVNLSDFSDYSYVIICETENASDIKNYLIRRYCNLSPEKIILFWKTYRLVNPEFLCDKLIKHESDISGIILGTSYAFYGINTECFDKHFVNLSVPGQDIYHQLKTMEYSVEKYPNKFNKLEYAVIDLGDYNYFNYSVSTSGDIIKYWNYGGYKFDGRRSENEDNYLEKLFELDDDISSESIEIWKKYFSDICDNSEVCYYETASNNKYNVLSDEMFLKYNYIRNDVISVENKTIKENIDILRSMLDKLTHINPEIKIFTIIIPSYWETEMRDYQKKDVHKSYFDEIIRLMKERYTFKHIDFKTESDISNKKILYRDADYLNMYGALELTLKLKDIILKN